MGLGPPALLREHSTQRGPRRDKIASLGRTQLPRSQASTAQALHTSSTLQAAGLELSQGCFLGWEGVGGGGQTRHYFGVAKGQRFVLVDYAKKLIPKPPGSAKRKSRPLLGWYCLRWYRKAHRKKTREVTHTLSPPWGSTRPREVGGWWNSLCPCPDGTLAQNGHFPTGCHRASSSSSFSLESRSFQQARVGGGRGHTTQLRTGLAAVCLL